MIRVPILCRGLLVFVIALGSTCLFAQLHDNSWVVGYANTLTPNDEFGHAKITFSNGFPEIQEYHTDIYSFWHTNATMSDADGRWIFSFNGIDVENADFERMENGLQLNETNANDYGLRQGALCLPWPGDADRYALVYQERSLSVSPLFFYGATVEFAEIDMRLDQGLGAVTTKRQELKRDSLQLGKLSALRHGNGRDWWVHINRYNSARFYRYLFDPVGFTLIDSFDVDFPLETMNAVGQRCFSTDGRYFAEYNTTGPDTGYFLDLFEVDRCSGLFYNQQQIKIGEGELFVASGCAFSPNSRFVYVSMQQYILQYDLWAPDVAVSRDTVAVYDGFADPFATPFNMAQLASDGKIYLSTGNATPYLHIIHQPDLPGDSCSVEQRGIKLPVNMFMGLPTFPHYRLGPQDGSPCDTLGLDNMPRAAYRWASDTLHEREVAFHDLSYYEPATWTWDFGDGATSTVRHPTHIYAADGYYQVCLTVSNVNGSHTKCREVNIGLPVGTAEAHALLGSIEVYPNPTYGQLTVALERPLTTVATFELHDALGRCVHREQLAPGYHQQTITLPALSAGLYYYALRQRGRVLYSGPLSVQE